MDFTVGQKYFLGNNEYEIKEILGSGTVAVAYLAIPTAMPTSEVVIKVAKSGLNSSDLKIKDSLDDLRNEAKVLNNLNKAEDPAWENCIDLKARIDRAIATTSKRHVIALFDSGETGDNQPYQIQEGAPDAIVSFDIREINDERIVFLVMESVLRVIALAHQNGYALKDFEPNTKWDRIRLSWLDSKHEKFDLKIIDWNATGGMEYAAQDLLYFGGHLFRLLFNRSIPFTGMERNIPPKDLGSLARNWDDIAKGSRQILQKALHSDSARRYQKVGDLEAEFKWWLRILEESCSPDGVTSLQSHLWDLKRQEKFSQMLAIADVGWRSVETDEGRQLFQPWLEQARQELEKQVVLPIARARGTLLIGSFEKAVKEFEHEIRHLNQDSEAARRAHIYLALANIGRRMKEIQSGMDIRDTSEWRLLEHGVDELIKQHPDLADLDFAQALRRRPEFENWSEFQALNDMVKAVLEYKKIISDLDTLEQADLSPYSEVWLQKEAGIIEHINQIVERLGEATKIDNNNQAIRSRYQQERDRLTLRRATFEQYRNVETEVNRGREILEQIKSFSRDATDFSKIKEALDNAESHYQKAHNDCERILKSQPDQQRAIFQQNLIRKELENINLAKKRIANQHQDKQKEEDIVSLENQGEYIKARNLISQWRQADSLPAIIQNLEPRIIFFSNLQNELRSELDSVRINYSKLEAKKEHSKERLAEINKFGNKASEILHGASLPGVKQDIRFVFSSEIDEQIQKYSSNLLRLENNETRLNTLGTEDELEIIEILQDTQSVLESIGIEMDKGLQDALKQIEDVVEMRKRAEGDIRRQSDFDGIKTIVDELGNDRSLKAQKIREDSVKKWKELLNNLSNETEIIAKLTDGEIFYKRLNIVTNFSSTIDQIKVLSSVDADLLDLNWLTGDYQAIRLEKHLNSLQRLRNSSQDEAIYFITQKAGMLWERLTTEYIRFVSELLESLQVEATQVSKMEKVLRDVQQRKILLMILPENIQQRAQLFKRSLEAYEHARKELVDDARSFLETAHFIGAVSLDGLRADYIALFKQLQTEWQTASQMEQLQARISRLDDTFAYAGLLKEVLDLEVSKLAKLDEQADIKMRLDSLRGGLGNQKSQASSKLLSKASQAVTESQQYPESETSALLSLYWQMRWYLAHANSMEEKKEYANACRQIESCHEAMDKGIVDRCAGMSNQDDLQAAIRLIRGICYFLQGLRKQSDDLPPFQNKDDYETISLPDTSRYERLNKALTNLEAVCNAEKSFDVLEGQDLLQTQRGLETIQKYLSDIILNGLPRETKPNSPGHLSRFIDENLLPLCKALQNVGAVKDQDGIFKAYLYLEKEGKRQRNALVGSTDMHWLLRGYQEQFRQLFDQAQEEYQAGLLLQAQSYLRDGLPNQVWERLMKPCEEDARLCELIQVTIIQAAEKESGMGGQPDHKRRRVDKGRATHIWQTVSDAAQKGKHLLAWQKLHETAEQRKKALQALDPRVLRLLIGVALVLLFVFAYWGFGLVRESQEFQAEARYVRETSTMAVYQTATQQNIVNMTQQALQEVSARQTQLAKEQTAVAENAISTQMTKNAAGTATQQANGTATAAAEQAEIQRCLVPDEEKYKMQIANPQAVLFPQPGTQYQYSIDRVPPEVSASWSVVNAGTCPWPLSQLTIKNASVPYKMLRIVIEGDDNLPYEIRNNGAVTRDGLETQGIVLIPAGKKITITIVLHSVYQAVVGNGKFEAQGTWELFLVPNSILSIRLGSLDLGLPEKTYQWIILLPTSTPDGQLSPSPTNALIPTKTPKPTDTRIPTKTPKPTETRVPTKTPKP